MAWNFFFYYFGHFVSRLISALPSCIDIPLPGLNCGETKWCLQKEYRALTINFNLNLAVCHFGVRGSVKIFTFAILIKTREGKNKNKNKRLGLIPDVAVMKCHQRLEENRTIIFTHTLSKKSEILSKKKKTL